MFGQLSERLEAVFKKLRGEGKLTESNIKESLREVQRALLEADVNFKIVKNFIAEVQTRAIGQEVLSSLNPTQQLIKIVNEQLTALLGSDPFIVRLHDNRVTKIMMVGLQGSGKTTTTAKLASSFRKKQNAKPMLVACDIYRPAAIHQLEVLGKSLNIPVISSSQSKVLEIAKEALGKAKIPETNLLIFDTAGRLHIDSELMQELKDLKALIKPDFIFFVADAMTGQDAVNVAKEFNNLLEFSGVILTKMDGDARGGAALSIRAVTDKPLAFIGVGEKISDLEEFYPDRMASRILGMGDILSLIEKAEATMDQKKAEELEARIRKNLFTFNDFLTQLQQIKKMGPLEHILKLLPGINNAMLKDVNIDEKELGKVEAIIYSMTVKERENPKILNGSRRLRIANGAGTSVQQVNRLLKQYEQMKEMMKKVNDPRFMKKFKLPF